MFSGSVCRVSGVKLWSGGRGSRNNRTERVVREQFADLSLLRGLVGRSDIPEPVFSVEGVGGREVPLEGVGGREGALQGAHCEAAEVHWLQGDEASSAHSFRDADPRPVIPKNEKSAVALGWR